MYYKQKIIMYKFNNEKSCFLAQLFAGGGILSLNVIEN
jgi:hypothetical protein